LGTNFEVLGDKYLAINSGHMWVLNKAGVKRELLDTVKARKLAYSGHTMSKRGSCLEKEIMQGTMPGARRRGRPRTAWMDNINTWTGLPVDESIRVTEDRDKWRKLILCGDHYSVLFQLFAGALLLCRSGYTLGSAMYF